MVSFLVPFWSQFWPQNDPQTGHKICPKNNNFRDHFWIPLLGLGALRLPIGSLLGPPKALLGGLWTLKTLKNKVCKVFANATFWVFGALDGPLGPILAPSCADLVPKLTPKWPQKSSKKCSKTSLKNDPQNYKKWTYFGPQNGPQNGARRRSLSTGKFDREFLKRSCFLKMVPRWLKMAPRSPR